MIRIAVFADLHANYPALKALLKEITRIGADRLISLGDAVAIGPHPNECIELLRETNVEGLIGNHEEYLLNGLTESKRPACVSDGELEHQLWTRERISKHAFDFIRTWNHCLDCEYGSARLKFFHSPYTQNDTGFSEFLFTGKMNGRDMDKAFAKYNADVFCFGHSHAFSDIQTGKRYVNPGSVACHGRAYARFSLLELHAGLLNISHHQVPYDRDSVIRDMTALKVPDHRTILSIFFGVSG